MSSRQRLYIALLVGYLFIFLAGPARGAKLYVVYASISGTQAIGWVAKEAGLFAKNGLDVELLFTGGGRAITSLLGGDTPIVTVGGPSAIAARLAGSDVIITAHIFDTILYPVVDARETPLLRDRTGKILRASRF